MYHRHKGKRILLKHIQTTIKREIITRKRKKNLTPIKIQQKYSLRLLLKFSREKY